MTPAQEEENFKLIAEIESHKRQGIPITTKAFVERLIKALEVKS